MNSISLRQEANGCPAPSSSGLQTAIAQWRAALGAEHVLASPDDCRRHSQVTIPHAHQCACVLRPGSVAEVQAAVRIAASHGLHVWTFGRGHNWGYGTKTAAHPQAVVLLLDRLNCVREVDEELAYAVVEPGVTQQQLADQLAARGGRLWADCTDSSPHGSVLGNALERGLGYTPYGDHFGQLCGLEVVLPDGELLYTGGGPPNCATHHTFKWGTGPVLDGLFSQSNLGIVTAGGIWLMPAPECMQMFVFELRDPTRLPHVIDAARRLALAGAIRSNFHMVNDVLLGAVVTQFPHELAERDGYLGAAGRAALRARYGLPHWTMVGAFYGTRAQVAAQRSLVRCQLGRLGKLTVLSPRHLAWLVRLLSTLERSPAGSLRHAFLTAVKQACVSPAAPEVLRLVPAIFDILRGIPSEHVLGCAYFRSRRRRPAAQIDPARDGCGLIWFAPVVPLASGHVEQVRSLCEACYERHGFDFAMSFIMANARSVVMLMAILYDRESPEETARASALYEELAQTIAAAGYQQYRTSVHHMHRLLATNPVFARTAAAIKGAIDPGNVLAPQRYGVGPAAGGELPSACEAAPADALPSPWPGGTALARPDGAI
ncbi:MAG: FAD-binding oxidoreductase [Pirellulales bacterium]|nr:FAD-binding oxidoreductase [Pirellulales bacterium]